MTAGESLNVEEDSDKKSKDGSFRTEEACDMQLSGKFTPAEKGIDTQASDESPEFDEVEDIRPPREITLSEEIFDIIDIIPVSMSAILEELYRRGRNVSIPALMTELLDMAGSGKIIQNGAYYRKPGVMPGRIAPNKAV